MTSLKRYVWTVLYKTQYAKGCFNRYLVRGSSIYEKLVKLWEMDLPSPNQKPLFTLTYLFSSKKLCKIGVGITRMTLLVGGNQPVSSSTSVHYTSVSFHYDSLNFLSSAPWWPNNDWIPHNFYTKLHYDGEIFIVNS